MTSKKEYLRYVARETAHLAYSSRMSNMLEKGTKKVVVSYFVYDFQLKNIWDNLKNIAENFDLNHRKWTYNLANKLEEKRDIKRKGKNQKKSLLKDMKKYNSKAIAAKFINLFLFHLMKYKQCRPLYKKLHLPLDNVVFKCIKRKLEDNPNSVLKTISKELINGKKTPYSLTYNNYYDIQNILNEYLKEYNSDSEIELTSRVELNAVFWAAQKRLEDIRR